MDKLRRAFGGDSAGPTGDRQSSVEEGNSTNSNGNGNGGLFADIRDSATLSYSTRIKGFIACFLIGFLFTLLGSMFLFLTNTRGFGICYTFGSIVGLCSTMFLMGPINQVKKMFDPVRLIATIIMLVALVLTLMSALYWKKGGLTLIFIIIQFLAMTWYSLSYIPYARDAAKKIMGGMCGF